MARYTRNERIAILVIEDQIYTYFNSILNRLIDVYPFESDSDDITGLRNEAINKFKDMTDTDIYTALGEAYGYDRTTIITKLNKQKRRVETWNKYYNDPDKYYFDGTATLLNKDLADICYILQYREPDDVKISKIISEGIINHKINDELLAEDDIWEIDKIIRDRSDAIYDGNPDSKIAPALTTFEREMMKVESSDIKVEKEEIPEEDPKITDGNVIKNALKDVVETYTAMGCTAIQFEINLDNGSSWFISFRQFENNN